MWSRKDRLYLSERLVPATGDVKEETESLGAQRTRSAGLGATMSKGGGKEGLDRWIKRGRKEGRVGGFKNSKRKHVRLVFWTEPTILPAAGPSPGCIKHLDHSGLPG